jgi:c-di-GMP-binding flagellar brake protein YcgR
MPGTKPPNKNLPFKIWEKVELIVGDGREAGIYISRVEDIKEDHIIATTPDFVRGGKLLTANTVVMIQYQRSDALYRIPARLKQIRDRSGPGIQLYAFGRIERVQRRNYVRIKKKIKIKYALLKNDQKQSLLDRPIWFETVSRDISAGGILVKCENNIAKDNILVVNIREYDEMGIPRFICAICRRIFNIEKDTFAGIEFIIREDFSQYFTADEKKKLPSAVTRFNVMTQNKMVRYIFDEQVKERQKGLL